MPLVGQAYQLSPSIPQESRILVLSIGGGHVEQPVSEQPAAPPPRASLVWPRPSAATECFTPEVDSPAVFDLPSSDALRLYLLAPFSLPPMPPLPP